MNVTQIKLKSQGCDNTPDRCGLILINSNNQLTNA